MYCRITLSDLSFEMPAALPPELFGLADSDLADLSAALSPVPDQFDGVGYWPAVEADVDAPEVDAEARRVRVPIALAPLEPQPKILGKLEFIGLVQMAGGMTDAQLVTAYKAPELEAFWVKYQMASQVVRDHEVTAQALGALDALGFIPNGAAAVIEAWPAQ